MGHEHQHGPVLNLRLLLQKAIGLRPQAEVEAWIGVPLHLQHHHPGQSTPSRRWLSSLISRASKRWRRSHGSAGSKRWVETTLPVVGNRAATPEGLVRMEPR